MWGTGVQWLRLQWLRLQWLGQRPSGSRAGIEPHPPLAGDRDERRLERARFEAETQHVGRGPDDSETEPGREGPP